MDWFKEFELIGGDGLKDARVERGLEAGGQKISVWVWKLLIVLSNIYCVIVTLTWILKPTHPWC